MARGNHFGHWTPFFTRELWLPTLLEKKGALREPNRKGLTLFWTMFFRFWIFWKRFSFTYSISYTVNERLPLVCRSFFFISVTFACVTCVLIRFQNGPWALGLEKTVFSAQTNPATCNSNTQVGVLSRLRHFQPWFPPPFQGLIPACLVTQLLKCDKNIPSISFGMYATITLFPFRTFVLCMHMYAYT